MSKRIVVVSDSHGKYGTLEKVILRYKEEAHCFIHCGDGTKDVVLLQQRHPDMVIHTVAGNCDWDRTLPMVGQITVEGKAVFFTHGHRYQVKQSLEEIKAAARNVGADIVLFGHTHQAISGYDDGLYYLNPGSLSSPCTGRPTVGVIDIGTMGIVCNLVEVAY